MRRLEERARDDIAEMAFAMALGPAWSRGSPSSPQVPILSAVIEADTAEGDTLIHEQRMTPADYAFDRAALREMLTRTGAEQGLPAELFERIESAVDALPGGRIEDFVALFTAIEPRRAAA